MTKKKITPAEERRNEIKTLIRNNGISRLPTYRELGERFNCSGAIICMDIKKIVTELSPYELDEVFTDFYQTDLRALDILRAIIHKGEYTERISAIKALVNLQEGVTRLLEAFAKKKKVADKVEVAQVSYSFTMHQPDKSKEEVYVIEDGTRKTKHSERKEEE